MKRTNPKAGPFFGTLLLRRLLATGDRAKYAFESARPEASALVRVTIRWAVKAARGAVERCAVVCVSTSGAAALTLVVGADAGYNLCLPFCIAVVFGAWYGAIGQGVVAALLSALLLERFLDIPLSKADLNAEDFKLVGVFALVSLAASWFNVSRRRTLEGYDKANRTPREPRHWKAPRGGC